MYFFLTHILISCTHPNQNLSQSLEITSQAIGFPADALEICSKIQDSKVWNHCLSTSASLLTSATHKSTICQNITEQTLQDECFFEIADSTGDASWCRQSGSFQTDCALHMLQSHGGKYHQLGQLIQYSEQLLLDMDDHNTQHMLFSIFLQGKATIPIEQCSQSQYQHNCEEYATRLYLQNLQHLRPDCESQPRLFQSNHLKIKALWNNYCNQR